MEYTVCFLFDGEGQVLLQRKDRTDFRGKLNGVGGKIEGNEGKFNGAVREIGEETGVRLSTTDLTWIGTLYIPENCDERHRDERCVLHFMAAVVDHYKVSQQKGESETLQWVQVDYITQGYLTHENELAGDGDLEYFFSRALRMLDFTKSNGVPTND